jgi:hypothetical protein
LFVLKEPPAREDLERLVHSLVRHDSSLPIDRELVLLLDGYDEIDYSERVKLLQVLRELDAVDHVRFIMTCRTYYEVISLPVERYYLQPFTEDDALAFLGIILAAEESKVPPETLLQAMKNRGFSDFVQNPLFLALSAILQRGDNPQVPRNAVRLLEEVTYYLMFQWDRERGVNRQSLPNIDGRDLLACLKRIALAFPQMEGGEPTAERQVREHLELMQNDRVDVHTLLLEIARWFGLFVPSEPGRWSFVHRTVHEYLAAKQMTETGQFNLGKVRTNWRRAHYAACLSPDATDYICHALRSGDELEMFVECCANDAYFLPVNVARALIDFYETPRESCRLEVDKDRRLIRVALDQDYLEVVKSPFLQRWAELAIMNGDVRRGRPICLALALSELRRRREPLARHFEVLVSEDYQWEIARPGLDGVVKFSSRDASKWN